MWGVCGVYNGHVSVIAGVARVGKCTLMSRKLNLKLISFHRYNLFWSKIYRKCNIIFCLINDALKYIYRFVCWYVLVQVQREYVVQYPPLKDQDQVTKVLF